MKIECILRRPGGTMIEIADKRIHFAPEDGADGAPHVANVDHEAIAKRLLSITEAYRLAADDTSGFRTDEVVNKIADAVMFTVKLPASIGHLRAALEALGATNVDAAITAGWPDRAGTTPPAKTDTARTVQTSAPHTPVPPVAKAMTQPLTIDKPSTEALGATPSPKVIAASAPDTTKDADASSSQEQDQTDTSDDAGDGGKADQSGDEGPSGLTARLSAMSDAEIRAEFERVVGRRPSTRAHHDTMVAQIVATIEEA